MPVPQSPFERWFVRASLALALTTPFILWTLALALSQGRSFTLELNAATTVDGTFQLFYDRGAGFRERESVSVPVRAGTAPVTVRLDLPIGTFDRLRLDPPAASGRFVIASARILDSDGGVFTTIPVDSLQPAAQITRIDSGPPAVFDSPSGSTDPQLLWQPAAPLVLQLSRSSAARLAATCLLEFAAALLIVTLLTRLLQPVVPRVEPWMAAVSLGGPRRPARAIVCAAAFGTLVAMYPIVFLGKSLVSPENGPAAMLYDKEPFMPGEHDANGIEQVRQTDVGAVMWSFLPYSVNERLALSEGEWPFWNRNNAAGRPLWGQGQLMMLDPLHWATIATPNVALGWDIKFLLHRFVFASGIGFAVFAATGSWPAAMLMAALAPFAGYFLFRLNHPAQFMFTYAAWMMWAWIRLASATSLRDIARWARWLAIFTALVLVASPPKESTVMLLCGYGTGALACLLAWKPLTVTRLRLGAAAAAGAVAILLSAPNWLIFATTLRQSLTDYDMPAARFATWPFAASIVFGALPPGQVQPGGHPMAFFLWIAAMAIGGYTWRHPVRAAATIGPLATLAIAFGAIPASVIVHVPLLANIHQIDYSFIGAGMVLMFIAAGIGAAGLIEGKAPTRLVTGLLAASIVGAAIVEHSSIASRLVFLEAWILIAAALVGILGLPLLRLAARSWPAPLAPLTFVVVAALVVSPNGLHAVTGIERIDQDILQPRNRADFTAHSPAIDAVHQDRRVPSRAFGLGEVLFPGTQVLFGLEAIGGPDALELPRYEELINAAGVLRYWTWNQMIREHDLPRLAPLLNLLNVRYVVANREGINTWLPQAATLTELPQHSDAVVAIRRGAEWPRAFFASSIDTYSGVADFVNQMNGATQPFASIERADDQARRLTAQLTDSDGSPVPATNYHLSTNRTSFRIRAPSAGVAVLTESWMGSDFTAAINGQPTPYFRVNHAFKGVAIPGPGDWTIEFVYRPAWWTISLAIALIGVAGLFASRFIGRA